MDREGRAVSTRRGVLRTTAQRPGERSCRTGQRGNAKTAKTSAAGDLRRSSARRDARSVRDGSTWDPSPFPSPAADVRCGLCVVISAFHRPKSLASAPRSCDSRRYVPARRAFRVPTCHRVPRVSVVDGASPPPRRPHLRQVEGSIRAPASRSIANTYRSLNPSDRLNPAAPRCRPSRLPAVDPPNRRPPREIRPVQRARSPRRSLDDSRNVPATETPPWSCFSPRVGVRRPGALRPGNPGVDRRVAHQAAPERIVTRRVRAYCARHEVQVLHGPSTATNENRGQGVHGVENS